MTIYVDELPKSCERCPFHDTKYGICDISGSRVEYFGCHSLTPLSDYTKQVRKEVCEEIRELAKKQTDFGFIDEKITLHKLFEILKQIQGEAK